MKLPWQKSEDSNSETKISDPAGSTKASQAPEAPEAEPVLPKGYTAPKGRPTPRRRDQEIERGVIRDPNAKPAGKASAERKQLKKSMSKQEWRAYKNEERAESRERNRKYQERIDAGDERFLPQNDRGEERKYARDIVDSQRYFNNLVMPVALILLVIMIVGTWAPIVANVSALFAMVIIVMFFIEGLILANRVNKAVKAKFPGTTANGLGMGFYAYSRATQPRKWRTPKPQVKIGETV